MIKELGMIPYEIELLLKIDNQVALKSKQIISELLLSFNNEDISDKIRKALSEIVDGKCIGKNDDVYCIQKAFGKECCMPKKENCIGCGSEMYLKTFLNDLREEIASSIKRFQNAKTNAEKFKWKSIIENKLLPAAYEVLFIVKYTYKQDITEYQKKFLGDDLIGIISID
ncbi:hypothetical protein FRZ06_11320 [Anoxybacterium hadale]|uniref:Uncharacterized protein n=1 Tax=Anoxybacterium hadale TaxID=3408580 RepID=A0ACD1ABL6_9FIRM|nr:hypothetical protein FRZ06_11320 [Clostridiales bacterium]